MNKLGLYDIFYNNWYKNRGTVYLYSDPHFNDKEMEKIRKVDSDFQIKRIYNKVKKNDTIIFLGDIVNVEEIKKIRGYKVLILGNHDKGVSNYEEIFDEVYKGPLVISDKIILSHEPLYVRGLLNIHGHDHSGSLFIDDMMKDFDCDIPMDDLFNAQLDTVKKYKLNHINVTAEWINYEPISLNKILKSGVLKNIINIHRLTIDKRLLELKK